MAPDGADRPPLLRLRGLSKTFGDKTVLADVGFDVEPGEVHALAGQNGSGKSTLIKILAGYHHPAPGGQVWTDGVELHLPVRPREAAARGLCFLHQDLALAPSMTIAENILVGRGFDHGVGWRVRWGYENRLVQGLLDEYGVAARPSTPVSEVSEIDRAIIAILRALEQFRALEGRGVIVLDEPTAFLPRREVSRVFAAIRAAVETGAGVIFVSHRLDEVRTISDRISVLRDGALVGTLKTAESEEKDIVRLLLGRDLADLYPEPSRAATSKVVLRVERLGGGELEDVSFDLHHGEVLGMTGLLDMGQDQLPYLLAGMQKPSHGRIELAGRSVRGGDPRGALRAGMALLPADRKTQSSLQSATVGENVTLPVVRRYWKHGLLRHRQESREVATLLQDYSVVPPLPGRRLSSLSGGNQQKALLAKWMQTAPSVLVLHEPTQGVDIGARSQIFRRLEEAVKDGASILICSSEYEDLAHLCDRVLVLREGSVAQELSGQGLSEDGILRALYVSSGAS